MKMKNTKTEYVYVAELTTLKWQGNYMKLCKYTRCFKDFIDVCDYLRKYLRKDKSKYNDIHVEIYVLEVNSNFYYQYNNKEIAKILSNKHKDYCKGKSSYSPQHSYIFIINIDKNNDWVIDEMIGDLDKHILDLNFKLVPVETVD